MKNNIKNIAQNKAKSRLQIEIKKMKKTKNKSYEINKSGSAQRKLSAAPVPYIVLIVFVILAVLGVLSTVLFPSSAAFAETTTGQLIPSGNDSFYYKAGGGQAIPVPAFIDQQTIPLHAEGALGIGYNCGVFDPKASIVNSLNNIKNGFLNIQQTVINNATAAVLEFPMYIIARANPDLYNLINNNILGAREDFGLSTKSCQVIENQIAQGKNPYQDWAKISAGHDWKYYMSLNNGEHFGNNDINGVDATDINQVKNQIAEDDGSKGVLWVQGTDIGRGGLFAGGKSEPAILVLHDTAIAGYNVIIGNGRAYNDTSSPRRTDQNAHLVDTWHSPLDAADWMTKTLGDEKITTYSGGEKTSSPGVGLLPEIHDLTLDVGPKIANLVSAQSSMSLDNLKEVSAPSVMVNQAVIENIRQLSSVNQSIYVSKLAQIIATARVADKAQLTLRLLQSGSQVPAIFANKAAQDDIQAAEKRTNDDLQGLMFDVNVNHLVSDPIASLMQKIKDEQLNASSIQVGHPAESLMTQGAISQQQGK